MLEIVTAPMTCLGAEVESWLLNQPLTTPEEPIRWQTAGRSCEVRNPEHLAVLVSVLDLGRFGVLERPGSGTRRWGQTMRTRDGWIVEVHDGSDQDFAQRVHRGPNGLYPRRPAESDLHPHELWPTGACAEVLWSWLAGGLPLGCSRTLQYLSPEQRQRYGFADSP